MEDIFWDLLKFPLHNEDRPPPHTALHLCWVVLLFFFFFTSFYILRSVYSHSHGQRYVYVTVSLRKGAKLTSQLVSTPSKAHFSRVSRAIYLHKNLCSVWSLTGCLLGTSSSILPTLDILVDSHVVLAFNSLWLVRRARWTAPYGFFRCRHLQWGSGVSNCHPFDSEPAFSIMCDTRYREPLFSGTS